jgi:hypothetical protein
MSKPSVARLSKSSFLTMAGRDVENTTVQVIQKSI